MSLPVTTTVSALVFFIRDVNRTERFYRNVLGLDTERTAGHHGNILTAQAGEISLVFLPAEEAPGHSPVVVFGLSGGIEEAVEALARHNVEIVTPVSEAPDGGLTADFLDPDGHVLSFYQPAEAPRRVDA